MYTENPQKDTIFLEDSRAKKWREWNCFCHILCYKIFISKSGLKQQQFIISHISMGWPGSSFALWGVNWRIEMAEQSKMSLPTGWSRCPLPAGTPGGPAGQKLQFSSTWAFARRFLDFFAASLFVFPKGAFQMEKTEAIDILRPCLII